VRKKFKELGQKGSRWLKRRNPSEKSRNKKEE